MEFFEFEQEIESMMLNVVNEGKEETLKEKVDKEKNPLLRIQKRKAFYEALERMKTFE